METLYGLFCGDLGGGLEDGIQALLGLTGMGDAAMPISLEDLLRVLKRRNQLELEDRLGATCWERVLRWAARDPAAGQTQAEVAKLWRIQQPSVSQTLQQLTAAGALPRCGREPIQYLLTGTTRLVGVFWVGTQGASFASSRATWLGRLSHRGNGIQLLDHLRVNICC